MKHIRPLLNVAHTWRNLEVTNTAPRNHGLLHALIEGLCRVEVDGLRRAVVLREKE